MTTRDIWRLRYQEHKSNAKNRGIPFLLTFKEWCAIWRKSGKWNRRGPLKGQYVMARPGDRGAYEKGNVIICLQAENHAERNRAYPMHGEDNPAYGKDYWASASPKERKRRKLQHSKILLDKQKSDHMRTSLSSTVTGRRAIVRDGQRTWAYPSDVDYSSANGWS